MAGDEGGPERWPGAGVAFWAELRRSPGRFALLAGDDADALARDLADLVGTVPLHVGQRLAEFEHKPNEAAVRACLRGHPVLAGIEVLFDPVLALEPIRLLAMLAKEHALAVLWPVPTGSDRLAYPPDASPGYNLTEDLKGCLLLTTRSTIFSDDAPFTVERFR